MSELEKEEVTMERDGAQMNLRSLGLGKASTWRVLASRCRDLMELLGVWWRRGEVMF